MTTKIPRAPRFVLAFALWVACAADAGAATLDPLFRLLEPAIDAPLARQADVAAVHDEVLALEFDERTGELRVGAILRLDESWSGRVPDLSEIDGAVVGSNHGTLVTLRLPVRELPELRELEGVLHVDAARMMEHRLDLAIPAANVDDVWNGAPAHTGDGVLVGVIDSGLDFRHDDFRNADGSTRVKAMWDREGTNGTPPQGFTGGSYHTATDLNSAIGGTNPAVTQRDANGHGTHVAGTAAGNGRASNGQYRGVAYEADLLIASLPELASDKVLDAMNWMVQEAGRSGQPIAINMSLGFSVGARDGSAAHEQFIDQASGPGVVFVVAAGNEGQDFLHVTATPANPTATFRMLDYQAQGPNADFAYVEIWVEGDESPSISVAGSPAVPSGQQQAFQSAQLGVITIDNASQGVNPVNGDKQILIIWDDSNGVDPAPGDYDITFTGLTGTAHVWKAISTMTSGFPASDNGYSVGPPATARKAVAVGAWKTRNTWPSVLGQQSYSGDWGTAPVGSRAPFSSIGPARDGFQKPDLVAPGMAMVSALTADANPPTPNEYVVPGAKYTMQQGTSMAAPMVAGVIALMFEKNPTLTADEVLQILRSSASSNQFSGTTWNPEYGEGLLDAAAALAAVTGGSSGANGDADGDGRATVLDLVQLVNFVVDPVGHPLSTQARAALDVSPAAAGDGLLNAQDVARLVGLILGTTSVGRSAVETPFAVRVRAPGAVEGKWVQTIELEGAHVAAGQFELRVPEGTSVGGAVTADLPVVASRVGDRLRVLFYDLDGEIGPGPVRLHVPLVASGPDPARGAALDGVMAAALDGSLRSVVVEDAVTMPGSLFAFTHGPNPVSETSTVAFSLARAANVRLDVYDVRGRLVRPLHQGELGAGRHALDWDARDASGRRVAAGSYFYRLAVDGEVVTRKVGVAR